MCSLTVGVYALFLSAFDGFVVRGTAGFLPDALAVAGAADGASAAPAADASGAAVGAGAAADGAMSAVSRFRDLCI